MARLGLETHIVDQQVFWIFQSIDPQTNLPPLSGNLGFLPPSDGTGVGLGSVDFQVLPTTSASEPVVKCRGTPNTASSLIEKMVGITANPIAIPTTRELR